MQESIEKVVREILKRGNDVEIRTCKEGIKIIEVKKKTAAVVEK